MPLKLLWKPLIKRYDQFNISQNSQKIGNLRAIPPGKDARSILDEKAVSTP